MVKFSLEDRNDATDKGESSSSKSKRVRYSSDSEKDEANDYVNEASGGVNHDESTPDSSISVILTDPEVLDCTICFESLTVPVFQCENGHIPCSSCCTKLKNKCGFCSFPIGYNRCRAIEKVIESLKVLCQNSRYGCCEKLSLRSRKDHEDKCIHSPCNCRIHGCNFLGSCQQLPRHCLSKHSVSTKQFQYHCPLPFMLDKGCKTIILQEETEGALFILTNSCEIIGNMLAVNYVGPMISNRVFSYKLLVGQGDNTLRLRSRVENHSSIIRIPSRFALVPHDFFDSVWKLRIELCIQLSNSR